MELIFSYGDGSQALCHFGRKGMKWGQHIFTTENAGQYYSKMAKDLGKADRQVAKNQKAYSKASRLLESTQGKTADPRAMKYARKAAKYKGKVARLRGSRWQSSGKVKKAYKYEGKAYRYEAKAQKRLQKMYNNQRKQMIANKRMAKASDNIAFYSAKRTEIGKAMTQNLKGVRVTAPKQKTMDLVAKYARVKYA